MISVAENTEFETAASKRATTPRLGFLGVGWIGRNRMDAIAHSGCAEVCAIADPSADVMAKASESVPRAVQLATLSDLLELDLDGIVIATPSALHADQSIEALEAGTAVFCQKPLGRNAKETRRVIDAARASNKLLGVDLSYRFVNGVPQLHNLIRSGELGHIFAVDLVFHNAYGPDKAWFYDRKLSGGGCVIDLGIHLVDLALWCLDFPEVRTVSSQLFAQGRPLAKGPGSVEDFATARVDLETDTTLQLSCSWKLQAGCDAIIRASFYGTNGGVEFRNLNRSFYDFVTERFHGTRREIIAGPPDPWGGRAAVDWARRLSQGAGYESEIEGLARVAATLDAIYCEQR